jgi:hypothetical protein
LPGLGPPPAPGALPGPARGNPDAAGGGPVGGALDPQRGLLPHGGQPGGAGRFGRVRGLFIHLKASPAAATVLAQICCHKDALPQGAPTSPVVSNMICARMDRELLKLAKEHHCCYTRYADDLAFSKKGGAFPLELARRDEDDGRTILGQSLRAIIESNGFRPRPEKTWLFNRQARQVVTGLVVNAKRNVRREWVRQLRAGALDLEDVGRGDGEEDRGAGPRRGAGGDYLTKSRVRPGC